LIFYPNQFFIRLCGRSKFSTLLVLSPFLSKTFPRNTICPEFSFIIKLSGFIDVYTCIFCFSHDCFPPIPVHNLEWIQRSAWVHNPTFYYYKTDTLVVP